MAIHITFYLAKMGRGGEGVHKFKVYLGLIVVQNIFFKKKKGGNQIPKYMPCGSGGKQFTVMKKIIY